MTFGGIENFRKGIGIWSGVGGRRKENNELTSEVLGLKYL